MAFSDPFGLCPPYDEDPCNMETGDPNLDDPNKRQAIEQTFKASPLTGDARNPGLKNELWMRLALNRGFLLGTDEVREKLGLTVDSLPELAAGDVASNAIRTTRETIIHFWIRP